MQGSKLTRKRTGLKEVHSKQRAAHGEGKRQEREGPKVLGRGGKKTLQA